MERPRLPSPPAILCAAAALYVSFAPPGIAVRLIFDAATTAALLLALCAANCSNPVESAPDDDAGPARGAASPAEGDVSGIACLGRIEPDSRVRRLSAPYTELGPPILG